MKSQDVLVLLKLISLHRALPKHAPTMQHAALPPTWEGWDDDDEHIQSPAAPFAEQFTTRGLEASLSLSKSEVSKALGRTTEVGLVIKDRKTGYPRPNAAALLDFIVHGLKYVFPARPGPMVRGIPTAAAAPILAGQLRSAATFIYVWPDPWGKELGQRIEPLYKSVPYAVRRDQELYATLALVDAIRLGKPREVAVASGLLELLMSIQ